MNFNSEDYTENQDKPDILSSGLNVIGSGVTIPEGTVIQRNCRIFSSAKFKDKVIKSGSTLE